MALQYRQGYTQYALRRLTMVPTDLPPSACPSPSPPPTPRHQATVTAHSTLRLDRFRSSVRPYPSFHPLACFRRYAPDRSVEPEEAVDLDAARLPGWPLEQLATLRDSTPSASKRLEDKRSSPAYTNLDGLWRAQWSLFANLLPFVFENDPDPLEVSSTHISNPVR